eukprot:5845436-Amphidinium_carterae.1
MACILGNRKIQRNRRKEGAPLGLVHVPPRGHNTEKTWYFDMVAELAIKLARRCVTQTSQLFTTIVWR